jgi:hypothetical protein
MIQTSSKVSVEELKKLLTYDPLTGLFTWNKTLGSRALEGSKAGGICKVHGYHFIRLNRKLYRSHHLAWLYTYGFFPTLDIDHINQDRADNRMVNLREVSRTVNNYNTSQRKGYSFSKQHNKYVAYLGLNGKQKHLGLFDTLEEAKNEHDRAKAERIAQLCCS